MNPVRPVKKLYKFSSLDIPQWPPVMISEIKSLIDSLPYGKAPREDDPPELFKLFYEWWASILAKVFT